VVQAREGERDEGESRLVQTTRITWQNIRTSTSMVD